LTGRRDAVVRFYFVPGSEESLRRLLNPRPWLLHGDVPAVAFRDDAFGRYAEICGVSAPLSFSWAEVTGLGPKGVGLNPQP